MDSHCFQLEQGKVPLVVFVWGSSKELAQAIFEMTQKAECPRRLKIFAFEFYSAGRQAASQQEELQKQQGLYDTSFLEQISWTLCESDDTKYLRPIMQVYKLIQGPQFVEKDLPVGLLLKAQEGLTLQKNFDSKILRMSSTLSPLEKGSVELFSATKNSFSRISSEKGPPHVEWIPLFGSHEKISINFPSQCIFGPMPSILKVVFQMYHEWPLISDSALFFLMGLSSHMFTFQSCDLYEDYPQIQKMPSRVTKELLARYPGQTSLLSENHLLGMEPNAPKWEVVAKYKSMREFENNLNQIRSS